MTKHYQIDRHDHRERDGDLWRPGAVPRGDLRGGRHLRQRHLAALQHALRDPIRRAKVCEEMVSPNLVKSISLDGTLVPMIMLVIKPLFLPSATRTPRRTSRSRRASWRSSSARRRALRSVSPTTPPSSSSAARTDSSPSSHNSAR